MPLLSSALRLSLALVLAPQIATSGRSAPPATQDAPPPSASAPAATSVPAGWRLFQKHISIDWSQPAVRVDGRVVFRQGPLEFLACFPGKEHESVVRMDASATHLFMALGLIGISPGRPPLWRDATKSFAAPAGDLVDVSLRWELDGVEHVAPAFGWLRDLRSGTSPPDRPWVFAGSQREAGGALAAESSGAGVAVVDLPESLLSLSRNHVSANSDLWAEANTAAIPPTDTPVQVEFRPARRRDWSVRVDFRGQAWVNGTAVIDDDLADLVNLHSKLSTAPLRIVCDGVLRPDRERISQALKHAGAPTGAFEFVERK